jgi:hypothetical protein
MPATGTAASKIIAAGAIIGTQLLLRAFESEST